MDFRSWILRRNAVPDADKPLVLIQRAGQAGIPEGQLRHHVDLPKELVDSLLQALVSAGQVAVGERQGKRVYFAR
jgi:hypothetical protein